jgi:hypothetical protein
MPTLKMETVGFSETLGFSAEPGLRENPEEHIIIQDVV